MSMRLKSYITISTILLCSLPIGAQQAVSDSLTVETDTLMGNRLGRNGIPVQPRWIQ